MINEIIVKSRKEMIDISEFISKPSIVFSIRDVGTKPIMLHSNSNIKKVMLFEFEDWDKEDDGEIVITDFDAERIADEVLKYDNLSEEYDIYVNCEAGQSRSAGVAAAICKVLSGSDDFFFRTKHPNMLCYRKVFNALSEKFEKN